MTAAGDAGEPAVGTAPRGDGEPPFFDLMVRFVGELRAAGLPVSMAETLDAFSALKYVPMSERETFKAALGATLVKNQPHHRAFETVFEVFFSVLARRSDEAGAGGSASETLSSAEEMAGGAGGNADPAELIEALYRALLEGETNQMRALARISVTRFSGMEPGRPVGGTYYLYRTLRHLDLEGLLQRLMNEARRREPVMTSLEERLRRDEFEARLEKFREELRAEIRRRLVADRGAEAMARTLRKPLPEDIDFMHATASEMAELRRAIHPLTRKLASRLARKRLHGRTGPLDMRRTIRQSLSSGGVPLDPRFKKPHPTKPEIFLVCDISGSVAAFARFTLQLIHAMQSQFSRVRSFVFIDALDEVTDFFEGTTDFARAIHRVNTEAEVVWVDGHSDYGHAFEQFMGEHSEAVTTKSSIILLGDARNNYHASQSWTLKDLRARARHLYWLNPEPRGYWDTGDSILSEYAVHCDGTYECRNLRQLEQFVSEVI
jgi:uncharacterized protein